MKVGFFIGSLNFGGAERVMANLVNYMSANGNEVLVITKIKTNTEYPLNSNIKRYVLEENPVNCKGLTQFRILKMLEQILQEESPELLVAFTSVPNFRSIVVGKKLNIPVIVSVRSDPKQEYQGIIKWNMARFLFRFANAIVFQTENAADCFKKSFEKKMYIIPNPLSEECMSIERTLKKDPRIIAVGRLDDNKNFQMLIKAYSKRHLDLNGYNLVIYGEGKERKTLERLIHELDMSDRITLPGITRDSIGELRKSDIFVLTSNYEGMPNALMEAMSQGLAVISTDCPCGGPKFLIRHRENGILTPVGGTESLGDSLVEVCNNIALREQLGNNAREIINTLNPQVIYNEWMNCFEKVLEG